MEEGEPDSQYSYHSSSSGGSSLSDGGGGGAAQGVQPFFLLEDVEDVAQAIMEGDFGSWASAEVSKTGESATLVVRTAPGGFPLAPAPGCLSVAACFRREAGGGASVGLLERDVQEERDSPSVPHATAYLQLVCFLLRLVILSAKASREEVLADILLVSSAHKEVIMLDTQEAAVQGEGEARADALGLLDALAWVLEPRRKCARLARCFEYARRHLARHCFSCGKLHRDGAQQHCPLPRLCTGGFCRYQALSSPIKVDLFTELRLNQGFEVCLQAALASLTFEGDRRFALLHPVPDLFLLDGPGPPCGPKETQWRSQSKRYIDYAGLRAALQGFFSQWALAGPHPRLWERPSNRDIFLALLGAQLKAEGRAPDEVAEGLEAAGRSGSNVFFYKGGAGGGGGGGGGRLPVHAPPSTALAQFLTAWWCALQVPCYLKRIHSEDWAAALPPDILPRQTPAWGNATLFAIVPRGGAAAAAAAAALQAEEERAPLMQAAPTVQQAAAAASGGSRVYGAQQGAPIPEGTVCHHFHGSKLANWFSILQHGVFVLSNTAYMTEGAVLGPGVYFGREFSTSQWYAMGGVLQCVGIAQLTQRAGMVLDFGWALTCRDRELIKFQCAFFENPPPEWSALSSAPISSPSHRPHHHKPHKPSTSPPPPFYYLHPPPVLVVSGSLHRK